MRESMLTPGGENRFQKIKAIRLKREAEGKEVINLGVGEPEGGANVHARIAAATAILSGDTKMHRYQDNGCLVMPDFAQRFVQAIVKINLKGREDISFLPLPGIKPALQLVVEALGSWEKKTGDCLVYTMTNPGYPTPADVCRMVRGVRHEHLPLDPAKGFLFDSAALHDSSLGLIKGDLIMLNLPHNPTGIVGTVPWLKKLCEICSRIGVRLFNDAAYAFLTHAPEASTLTDVAVDYPDLNWAEAFSASKGGDDEDGTMCGWRVGALVGSPEFMKDIATIKGNVDSGFSAFSAIGVLELFEHHQDDLTRGRELYYRRLKLLTETLMSCGMRLSVEPKAGFFCLFDCPQVAFGQEVKDAEHFNQLMIEKTGVVGVYFNPYIRYAVCAAPVEKLVADIKTAFIQAQVSY